MEHDDIVMQSYAVVHDTYLTSVRTTLSAAERPRPLPPTPDGGYSDTVEIYHQYLTILDPPSSEAGSIFKDVDNDHLYEEATGVGYSATADICHKYITILDPPPPKVE